MVIQLKSIDAHLEHSRLTPETIARNHSNTILNKRNFLKFKGGAVLL